MSKPKNRVARYTEHYSRVCEILNLDADENVKNWEILDKVGDYVLVHYTEYPSTDLIKYGHLRGVIIDLETGDTVRQTFTYMPDCVHDAVPVAEDGSITLIPNDIGTPIRVKPGNYTIQFGHDGVVIDAWKDKHGKVHLSSLKTIDIDLHTSRWPRALDYYSIYNQLCLPDRELLFTKDKSSPFVHTFIMSHPDIFNVSKELIGSGYGIYLGYKKMSIKAIKTVEYEDDAVDIKTICNTSDKLNIVRKASDAGSGDTEKSRLIYVPQNISVSKANLHLRYGFYCKWDDENVDPRVRSGERVVLTETDTGRMLSIVSSAYNWRSIIKFEKFIPYCFFMLAHSANLQKKMDDNGMLNGLLPNLSKEDPVQIKTYVKRGEPIIKLIASEKLDLTKYEDRLQNVWLCMMLAVPIHQQIDVLSCIDQYKNKIEHGAAMAIDITKSRYRVDGRLYSTEVFNEAMRVAYTKKPKTQCTKFAYEKIQLDNIIRKLTKMKPDTAYRLIKLFEKEIIRVKHVTEKVKAATNKDDEQDNTSTEAMPDNSITE